MRAKPTTDRELRMMKRSRKTLHEERQARGVCIYCEAPSTTQYLGCAECLTYRSEQIKNHRAEVAEVAESAEVADSGRDRRGESALV